METIKERILSCMDAAKLLHLPRSAMQTLVGSGIFPSHNMLHRRAKEAWIIYESDVNKWIAEHGRTYTTRTAAKAIGVTHGAFVSGYRRLLSTCEQDPPGIKVTCCGCSYRLFFDKDIPVLREMLSGVPSEEVKCCENTPQQDLTGCGESADTVGSGLRSLASAMLTLACAIEKLAASSCQKTVRRQGGEACATSSSPEDNADSSPTVSAEQ